MEENNVENKQDNPPNNSQKQIAGAIIVAGILIAGAILIKGNSGPVDLSKASPVFNQCLDSGKYGEAVVNSKAAAGAAGVSGTPKGFILSGGNLTATIEGAEPLQTIKQKIDKALSGNAPVIKNMGPDPVSGKQIVLNNPDPVSTSDMTLGDSNAKVTIILYEDFQCPFCGKFFSESEKNIRDTYVKNGDVRLVYRDFAFIGPESDRAAEGARCAAEQNKFWEYHDYLFSHQMGENQGAFSDTNLKSFAGSLKLK
jgi:protein-disulfide isomerase